MKIHKNARIELIASTDKTRAAITNPYLDATNCKPYLVATNGHALVQIPVEATKEETGFVSGDVLKAARKTVGKKADSLTLERGGENQHTLRLPDGSTLINHFPDYQFPNWRQVIPSDESRKNIVRLALNPASLLAIAQAMDSGAGVVLEIESASAPIVVRPFVQGDKYTYRQKAAHPLADAKGVLMTIRME